MSMIVSGKGTEKQFVKFLHADEQLRAELEAAIVDVTNHGDEEEGE